MYIAGNDNSSKDLNFDRQGSKKWDLWIILISLLCNLNMSSLSGEFPQNITPYRAYKIK